MFVIELHSIYILVCYLSERPRVWKAQILLLLLLLLLLYWVVPKSLKGVPSWALGNGRSPEATLDIKCLHCKWHPWTLDHPLRCFKLILEILKETLDFKRLPFNLILKGLLWLWWWSFHCPPESPRGRLTAGRTSEGGVSLQPQKLCQPFAAIYNTFCKLR